MTDRRDAPGGVVGMIHLLPLPGAPRHAGGMQPILECVLADARALLDGGVDAILIENYGDVPFFGRSVPAVTVAAMTRAVAAVVEVAGRPVGINVLRNDAPAGIAIAAATGARFIRVNVHTGGMYTDQGWIDGRAAETIRLRNRLAPKVAVLADVMVKHASPPGGLTLTDAARDAWHRGLADALIVSGTATGAPTAIEEIEAVADAVPGAPILAGSGVIDETIAATLHVAHGAIVGSALMNGGLAGGRVDPGRVRSLVAAAR